MATQIASDDWTGGTVNDDIGVDHDATNWTNSRGSMDLLDKGGSVLVAVPDSTDCSCVWDGDAFDDDQYSQVVLGGTNASFRAGPVARMSADGLNGYMLQVGGSTNAYLKKIVGGTVSTIRGNVTGTYADNTWRLEVSGQSPNIVINVFSDGVKQPELSAINETDHDTGFPGIGGSANATVGSVHCLSWAGGNLDLTQIQEQEKYETKATSGTSQSITFAATPTSGNLLVAIIGMDKDSGAITLPTVGGTWTEIGTPEITGSVSGTWCYRVSDGTESGAITFSWATTTNDSHMWVAEFSGIDTLVGNQDNDTGESVELTLSTGTTDTLTGEGIYALAFWAADTYQSIDGASSGLTRTYSQSFVEKNAILHSDEVVDDCGILIAHKEITGTTAIETTFTTSGGDQMLAKIAAFGLGGGSILPNSPFNKPFNGPFGGPL